MKRWFARASVISGALALFFVLYGFSYAVAHPCLIGAPTSTGGFPPCSDVGISLVLTGVVLLVLTMWFIVLDFRSARSVTHRTM
jgi:hypothetical protein